VIGGGPAGLTFAIGIAELAFKHEQVLAVDVYDTRYGCRDGVVIYTGSRSAEGKAPTRREQVVTLQNSATGTMSEETRSVLFENGDEKDRVWGGDARNIAIREVEDRLLERAQEELFKAIITLHPVPSGEDALEYRTVKDAAFIVGSDGAGSNVRKTLFGVDEPVVEGRDFALGISIKIPKDDFPITGFPLHQFENCVLTVFQRRFLLNGNSLSGGNGFLNMQLSEEEFELAKRLDGKECVFGKSPGFVKRSSVDGFKENELDSSTDSFFKPQDDYDQINSIFGGDGTPKQEESAQLWRSILTGLNLFGIDPRYVSNIVGVKLMVQHAGESNVLMTLKNIPSGRTQIAALLGDAAFSTHFWPGRGMNSVIKEASVLASTVFCNLHRRRHDPNSNELAQYKNFMGALRQREHERRSLKFACQTQACDQGRCSENGMLKIIRDMEQKIQRNKLSVNDCITALRERLTKTQSSLQRQWQGSHMDFQNTFGNINPHEKFDQFIHKGTTDLRELRFLVEIGAWPRAGGDEVYAEEYIASIKVYALPTPLPSRPLRVLLSPPLPASCLSLFVSLPPPIGHHRSSEHRNNGGLPPFLCLPSLPSLPYSSYAV
jgi:2-polyprenyl-6-methoxyphenol hydroxylase-like FAD-dependent oxidoreductase